MARAEASRVEARLKVFIELRDTGYPGATYTLIHDAGKNVLEGIYDQPAVGQTFVVHFIPMKWCP